MEKEMKLFMLALDKLSDEYEKLKVELQQVKLELSTLKKQMLNPIASVQSLPSVDDELLDIKEVRGILGICYNSLKKLISQGKIKPIRINERRVRFSKASILKYIQFEVNKS